MTEQTQTFASVDDAVTASAVTFVKADEGRYDAVCIAVVAATLLAKEVMSVAGATRGADWYGARIAEKFEYALVKSEAVTLKTASNYGRTVSKAVKYAVEGFAKSGGLNTVDYTPAIVSASFEGLEGFKRNMRDLDAALTLALGGGTKKAKAAKASPSTSETAANSDGADVTAKAADVNETAKASEKVANAVKTLSALLQSKENHALFQTPEMGDLIAAIMEVRRNETEQGEMQQQAA